MRLFLPLALLSPLAFVAAAPNNGTSIDNLIWPSPRSLTTTSTKSIPFSSLVLIPSYPIPSQALVSAAISRSNKALSAGCQPASGRPLPVRVTVSQPAGCTSPSCFDERVDESYQLTVTERGVEITAKTWFGAVAATTSLTQLGVKEGNGTCALAGSVWIDDAPRFPWRGLLVDVSRNFFSIPQLKKVIDGMAYTKLNTLHFHAIDAQSFPLDWAFDNRKLVRAGAYKNNDGSLKIYTQQNIAELISYAFERGIRVVPEFDFPGHTAVWGKAYPDMMMAVDHECWDGQDPVSGKCNGVFADRWCNQPPCGQVNPFKEESYKLIDQFLGDMSGWFPSPWLGTGADEVNEQSWGLKNNATGFQKAIQTFQTRIAGMVKNNKRRMLVWDESILQYNLTGTAALPKDAVSIAWNTPTQEDVEKVASVGPTVVASYPHFYLDCGPQATWCAPFKSWETVYDYNPTAELSAAAKQNVIGGEVAMWSETMKCNVLEYALFPRVAAAGERLWSSERTTRSAATNTRLTTWSSRASQLLNLTISPLDWNGALPLYRPEWCDFNLDTPAQVGMGGNYCEPATKYVTNEIVCPV